MTADSCHHIPENVQTIHLIAVCGTAMGALAAMLQEIGFNVTGSDRNVYPPMSDFLEQRGKPGLVSSERQRDVPVPVFSDQRKR